MYNVYVQYNVHVHDYALQQRGDLAAWVTIIIQDMPSSIRITCTCTIIHVDILYHVHVHV